jgi:hypothetical protein
MTDPDVAEITAYIAAQTDANPGFDARVVWEEYTYERDQRP